MLKQIDIIDFLSFLVYKFDKVAKICSSRKTQKIIGNKNTINEESFENFGARLRYFTISIKMSERKNICTFERKINDANTTKSNERVRFSKSKEAKRNRELNDTQ